MPAAISAARWAAAHALMRGEPPTQERVTAAMGIHVTTLAHQRAKEGWVVLDFRRKDLLAAHAALWDQLIKRFLLGSAAAPDLSEAELPDGPLRAGTEDVDDTPELSLDEQVARLGRVLSRQIDRLLAAADASGGLLTKAQMDTLSVIMRLAERFGALATESAAEKQTRSDDELADILRRVDARIVELARGLAERMAARKTAA